MQFLQHNFRQFFVPILLVASSIVSPAVSALDPSVPLWEQAKSVKCTQESARKCFAVDRSTGKGSPGCLHRNYGKGDLFLADFERNQWVRVRSDWERAITGYNFAHDLVHQVSVGQKIMDFWVTGISQIGTFSATQRFSGISRENGIANGVFTNLDEFTCVVDELW